MDGLWTIVTTGVIWVIQGFVVFVVSTLLFDALHWLLHRWGRSKIPLLRTFSRWHWVHHAFLDRKMRVHPELVRQNLIYHVMPEYLTSEDRTEDLAGHVVEWLTDDQSRQSLVDRMAELKDRVAHGGASERAADYIVRELEHLGREAA